MIYSTLYTLLDAHVINDSGTESKARRDSGINETWGFLHLSATCHITNAAKLRGTSGVLRLFGLSCGGCIEIVKLVALDQLIFLQVVKVSQSSIYIYT